MKKVAVIDGGLSKEREISLKTGAAITKALQDKKYNVIEIDAKENLIEQLLKHKPDVAFIALHGRYGEDGCIQGLLEWMKIPYTGSGVFSSSLCFEKIATKKFLADENIVMPQGAVFTASDDYKAWIKTFNLKLPVIIKPNTEGSSIGLKRVFKNEELESSLKEALQFDSQILIEELIQGREMTVGVVDGKALVPVEVVPQSGCYDYESKYTKGKTQYLVPAILSEKQNLELSRTCERIFEKVRCAGAVRIDFILSEKDQKFYFLEVNTIPGMTETSLLPKAAAAEGVNFADLCEKILSLAKLHH